jgi:hypothetical protein
VPFSSIKLILNTAKALSYDKSSPPIKILESQADSHENQDRNLSREQDFKRVRRVKNGKMLDF